MIRVGAVGQKDRPATATTSYDVSAETAQPVIPRQRGAVDASSASRPPAA